MSNPPPYKVKCTCMFEWRVMVWQEGQVPSSALLSSRAPWSTVMSITVVTAHGDDHRCMKSILRKRRRDAAATARLVMLDPHSVGANFSSQLQQIRRKQQDTCDEPIWAGANMWTWPICNKGTLFNECFYVYCNMTFNWGGEWMGNLNKWVEHNLV